MDVLIRKANVNDYNVIAEIDVQSSLETYKDIMPDDYLLNRFNRIDEIKDKVKVRLQNGDNYLVILTNNKIVGYSLYYVSDNKCYLDSLYLLKDYHGKGLGKQLFMYTVNDMVKNGYNAMYLYCAKDNLSSSFYEKFGVDKKENFSYKIKDFVVTCWLYEYNNLERLLKVNNSNKKLVKVEK